MTLTDFLTATFRVFRRLRVKPHLSRFHHKPARCRSLEHYQTIAVQIIGCHGNEQRVTAVDRRTGKSSMLKPRETLPRSSSRSRVSAAVVAASARQLVRLIGRPVVEGCLRQRPPLRMCFRCPASAPTPREPLHSIRSVYWRHCAGTIARRKV